MMHPLENMPDYGREITNIVSTVSLLLLLDDPALRQHLGRAAQAEARSLYTWEAVARTVAEAYERLAAARAE